MTRGLWTRETVLLLLLAALLPLTLFWLRYAGLDALGRFALIAFVVAAWQLVFLLARAQPMSLGAALTALAIAVLAPEGLSAFALVLGASFGTVMGELVFGGWGRNVVHPATVALAFLGFGFPAAVWPEIVEPVAWTALPAVLIGAFTGVMPTALIASAGVVGGAALAVGLLPASALPAAAVVLVLLVADPVASASTALGRWLHGALFAGLLTLFAAGWAGAAPVQQAISAALLASLAAPALDDLALALWCARRRRLHGRA